MVHGTPCKAIGNFDLPEAERFVPILCLVLLQDSFCQKSFDHWLPENWVTLNGGCMLLQLLLSNNNITTGKRVPTYSAQFCVANFFKNFQLIFNWKIQRWQIKRCSRAKYALRLRKKWSDYSRDQKGSFCIAQRLST